MRKRKKKREREMYKRGRVGGEARGFSMELGLRPWPIVAKMWNEQSGETPITAQRVQQIGYAAEQKIRTALHVDAVDAALLAEDFDCKSNNSIENNG